MALTTSPLTLPLGSTSAIFLMDSANPWTVGSPPTFTLSGVTGAGISGVSVLTTGVCQATIATPAGLMGVLTITDSGTSRTVVVQVGESLRAPAVRAAAVRARSMNQPVLADELDRLGRLLAFVEAGTPPAIPAAGTIVIGGVTYPMNPNAPNMPPNVSNQITRILAGTGL